jgi:hypothetical protein
LFHIGHTELPNQLSDLGYPGDELMREALNAAFDEVDASCSRVDPHPQDPPAHVYVWHSRRFGRRMYLKFKLKGNRKKAGTLAVFVPGSLLLSQ